MTMPHSSGGGDMLWVGGGNYYWYVKGCVNDSRIKYGSWGCGTRRRITECVEYCYSNVIKLLKVIRKQCIR